MEGVFGQAFELGQAQFCQPPEAFDAIDMNAASR
ncbi:hypothetical protein MNBD_ALPHA07-126 [hydrothermal vent metagenome]|uniref:Uncharacterized protein n=1 Tax=hydrothermal vent metagenome TaxID=652676 RepID=A0A3B0SR28_9ZZZZ